MAASFFTSFASLLFQPAASHDDADNICTAVCKQESLPPLSSCSQQPPTAVAGVDGAPLGRVFRLLDQNSDGLLSVDEISQGFQKLGVDLPHEQLAALLLAYPLAKPGLLQLEEFEALYDSVCTLELAAMADGPINCAADHDDGHASASDDACEHDDGLLQAFRVFDKNADGFISLAELQSVLCSLGFLECRDASFCRGIVQRVDSNGDGLVDFSEFKHMMTSLH